MPIQYKIRRGSSSEANSLTLTEGEIYMDLDQNDLRVHNGTTPGGHRIPNVNFVNEVASNKVDKIFPPLSVGTVGSGSEIPVISYNEQGQIIAVSSAAINIPANIATESYVQTQISNLVDSSPTALDTLNELAAALNDDPNFATTIANILAEKAKSSDLATVAFSGNYYDLNNKPFIPNLTSQLMNDAGFVGVSGGSVTGLLTTQKTAEVINTKTNATGVVTHDFSSGSIWYHSNISANFTPNFTNVPTTDNRSIVNTLVLSQGAIPYIPTALQIDGVAQTIKWLGSAVPTGEAQTVNIISFVMIRTNNAWTVLGSLSLYG